MELTEKLQRIPIDSPLGETDKPTLHEERWVVCRFLRALSADPIMNYPLRLIHQDRPDFVISSSKSSVGVEVTRAGDQGYECALSHVSKEELGLVECSLFRPGFRVNTSRGARPTVTTLDDELEGPGWRGREADEEWVEFMLIAIRDKTRKLSTYERFDLDWLLIRDATPCKAVVHLREAASMLQNSLESYWSQQVRFSSVIVLSGEHVFQFSPSSMKQRQVVDLW